MLKEIYDLMADGDTITIAMTKKPEGEATVSILPSSKLKGLLPINTTGSVEEIEEKLPEIMNAPMARVKGKLVTNTADFEKSLESAETDQKPENGKPASTSTPGKHGRKPGSTKESTKPSAETATEGKETPQASVETKPDSSPADILIKEIETNLRNSAFDYLGAINKLSKIAEAATGTEKERLKAKIFEIRTNKAKVGLEEDLGQDEADEVVIPQSSGKIQPNTNADDDNEIEEAQVISEEEGNDASNDNDEDDF